MATPSPRTGLIHTIADALRARTCVVLVGLPGSGRWTTLRMLRTLFEDEEWTVRTLTGHGEHGRPLESLALSGVHAPSAGAPLTTVTAAQALSASARATPTLLLVADAHRLDEASATAIAAATDDPEVTVVLTIRPPYPGPASVDTILARRAATAIWMPAASIETIQRVVSDALGGEVHPDAAGRIYSLSGGLPGVARAIAVEARATGRLVQSGLQWTAERDLWSRGLAATLSEFGAGLSEAERDATWMLAELGPTRVDVIRGSIPWSVLTSLDDRGLVRFIDADDGSLIALYPPVLEEHLRHRALSARGLTASARASAARADAASPEPQTGAPVRPPLHEPMGWSSSPEAAAILGRLLREDARRRVAETRTAWTEHPTALTTIAHLQALLDDGADDIEAFLVKAEDLDFPPDADTVRLRMWVALYRAMVQREPRGAISLLDASAREMPHAAAALSAIGQHLRLMLPGIGSPQLPAAPPPADPDEPPALEPHGSSVGLPRWHTVDLVRLVRGEILLTGGRTSDAVADFASLSPADPLRRDPASVLPLAQLCDGDIAGAVDRSQRQLELARGTLDHTRIEPHGYVVALGLLLQGRMGTLRDHLTSLAAVNTPAVLTPESRAGLLSIGAALSMWEGNFDSARGMIARLGALDLTGSPYPYMSRAASSAALAMADGVPAPEATARAWKWVATLIDEGSLLAAVFEAARVIELHVDEEHTAQVAQIAYACQGTLLPALGAFLEGAGAQSPDLLLTAAGTLRERGLVLYGTRAHAMAVRHLRAMGRSIDAARESTRLRRLVHATGDDLSLVLSARLDPASVLTRREREVAHLIAAGRSNREVADQLVVSERTIDNHLYRVFRKLGVTSREELVGLV